MILRHIVIGVSTLIAAPPPVAQYESSTEVVEVAAGSDGSPVIARIHTAARPLPMIWPLRTPAGADVTRAYPMEDGREGERNDHPHHRSFWVAHGDVNGHDFWHDQATRIERIGEPSVIGATVRCLYGWRVADETILRETRTLSFHVEERANVVDLECVFTAGKEAVTFGDTKEGTFAVRLAPALRTDGSTGTLTDSEGRTNKSCWGKRSRWIHAAGPSTALTIFDHPDNLNHPTWWHARTYGLVAANPFGVHDFEGKPAGTGAHRIEPGETLRMRFRIIARDGAVDAHAIDAEWRAWANVGGSE